MNCEDQLRRITIEITVTGLHWIKWTSAMRHLKRPKNEHLYKFRAANSSAETGTQL